MSSENEILLGIENGLCHLRRGLTPAVDRAATPDYAHRAHSLNQTTFSFDGNV